MSILFNDEAEMQDWLSNEFNSNKSLSDLIINEDEFLDFEPTGLVETKVFESFEYCLHSLSLHNTISENENISIKEGEGLKPDFLLYAQETESIIIVELKNIPGPTRQAGTEVSAYSSEIKSYIPFISDGDIVNVIIANDWPTLLKHYVFHEIFWINRNIICLEPEKAQNENRLKIKDIQDFLDDSISIKLSEQHLGGYHICLYDYGMYGDRSNRTRLDPFVEQMKTALSVMAIKGNTHKNHGFAILWKDPKFVLAPYLITIVNIAPFQSIERFFHDDQFKPSDILGRIIDQIVDYAPEGHTFSLQTISEKGESFLSNFCETRKEGFHTWDTLKTQIPDYAELISFQSWGILQEIQSDKTLKRYKNGENKIKFDSPVVGMEMLDDLIDDNYKFIPLNYYNYDPDEDGLFEGQIEE